MIFMFGSILKNQKNVIPRCCKMLIFLGKIIAPAVEFARALRARAFLRIKKFLY